MEIYELRYSTEIHNEPNVFMSKFLMYESHSFFVLVLSELVAQVTCKRKYHNNLHMLWFSMHGIQVIIL